MLKTSMKYGGQKELTTPEWEDAIKNGKFEFFAHLGIVLILAESYYIKASDEKIICVDACGDERWSIERRENVLRAKWNIGTQIDRIAIFMFCREETGDFGDVM